MTHLSEFLAVAVIHFLALLSPGPDFAIISRSSLFYSRRTGVYCAAGLALGMSVHITYSLIGIGLIISRSILLFSIIKYLGAGYLIYIGIKSLRSRKIAGIETVAKAASDRHLAPLAAVRLGFLTNVLNPKVTLFFLGLFTQVIHPGTSLWLQILYGVEMCSVTFLWFSFVASLLSHSMIHGRFLSVQHIVERCFGGLLIALGVRVALEKGR